MRTLWVGATGESRRTMVTLPEDDPVVSVLESVCEFGLLGFADAKVGELTLQTAGGVRVANHAVLRETVPEGAKVDIVRCAATQEEGSGDNVTCAVVLLRVCVVAFGITTLCLLLRDIAELNSW
eukprot:Hpha_TRINITY_DN28236_c0_g1::TRINITY_DN28236_c0_g1_i1::g.116736::m.116736